MDNRKFDSLSPKNQPSDSSQFQSSKKDLNLFEYEVKASIGKIEEWVKNNESQRNYKMKLEFEREKEYKLEEQAEIKNQIEQLSNNNINEKLILHFKSKIAQQQELFIKYYEMRDAINDKIKYLKEMLPELDVKVNQKAQRLKEINKENLKLMDKITQLEKERKSLAHSSSSANNTLINESNILPNRSLNGSTSQNVIHINELVEENQQLKDQYNRILSLKKNLRQKRKENEHLSKAITEMNSDCFLFKRLFNEGIHEIAKELLKIHELQLDKVIQSSQNNNGSNLYFEIVKGRFNERNKDDELKLPIINNNIMKKYNYPLIEKINPTTLVYQVIKNMLEESYNLSKIVNMKKNKFEWEEFRKFSAYQIYTILNMNKDVMKKILANLFPRKIIIPNEEEKSFQSNNLNSN